MSDDNLRKSLLSRLVILLGENDIDTTDPTLRQTDEARSQGVNRLERGMHFFRQGIDRANRYDIPIEWKIETVPDAGHSDLEMSESALSFLI